MKLEWHPLARADLVALITYIATNDPDAAYRVHDEFHRQIQVLAVYPEIGRPGRVRGTRELVLTGLPYIVAYRVGAAVVSILRILHGAERWPLDL